MVNLAGALGPDISFDALWYHLTLAKLYGIHHHIFFIPGGLLYYSAMPKLAELLFAAAFSLGLENGPQLLQFVFGIFSCIVLYKIARKMISPLLALLCVLLFYTNLVVGWESITGYIDLIRVFFEATALYAFINWMEVKNYTWLYLCGLLIGFAITTKLLALSSLGILLVLGIVIQLRWKIAWRHIIFRIGIFALLALLVPLPWFIFSFITTGDPFYPFFSPYFAHLQQSTVTLALFNPEHIISTYWQFFTHASDPISPIYLGIVPLLFFVFKRLHMKERTIIFYTVGGLGLWYFVSKLEGTRLALPYIFSASIVVGIILSKIKDNIFLYRLCLSCIFLLAIISIFYRGIANGKFVPVLLGKETKAQFLTKHLNFSFGDWYDIDGYMAMHIKPTDTVLLYGYHNLYYVDFPYVHESWVKRGDKFDYIATNGSTLPKQFANWKLIYQNPITHVHLYSDGGHIWTY